MAEYGCGPLEAQLALDSCDSVGEGPAWNASSGTLIWSDNPVGIIHEAVQTDQGGWREKRKRNLGRHIAAAIPRTTGGLIIASGTEILALGEDEALRVFVPLEMDVSIHRINDAKCDPQGRLWAGSSDRDFNVAGQRITPGRCAMYRIDPDGSARIMFDGGTLLNGMGWSPDGEVFYSVESFERTIDAFDFDARSGNIANRRTVVRLEVGDGIPDGMCIDSDGCLWVAVPGTGEVRRYSARGRLLATVSVPTPTPTSCAFCGSDGAQLAITSSISRLSKAARQDLSHGFRLEKVETVKGGGAGGLFICRPGVSGMPATSFAG